MLDELALVSAEDARGVRPGDSDRLVVIRDLERVALRQAEPLPDLARDHDPAEVVDVTDDARRVPAAPRPVFRAHSCPRALLSPSRAVETRVRKIPTWKEGSASSSPWPGRTRAGRGTSGTLRGSASPRTSTRATTACAGTPSSWCRERTSTGRRSWSPPTARA